MKANREAVEAELSKIRAKHAEELEKAGREAVIRHALPVPPRYVHTYNGRGGRPGETHISYKADGGYPKPPEMTLSEALALVEALPPEVALMREAGCLSVHPAELMEDSYAKGKDRGSSLLALVCSTGRGFGPDWSLEWFSRHPEAGWLRVHVAVQTPAVRAYVAVRSWSHGEPLQVEKHADRIPGANLISWGSGSRDAGRWSWHFPSVDALRDFAEGRVKAQS